MQYLKKSLLAISIFSILVSCQNSKKTQENLHTEVMSVHDSLMMDMGKLSDSKEKLTTILSKLDSLKSIDSGLDTTILKNKIYDTKLSLTKADDAMMDWMNGFNPDYTNKSAEEVESYLNLQKLKIDSVKTLFQKSLLSSDSIITKYQ